MRAQASRVLFHRGFLAASVLLASNCSIFGPDLEAVYDLEQVDGKPLPAAHESSTGVDGSSYEYRILRGSLRLFDNGRFAKERDGQDMLNGAPWDSVYYGRWTGSWEQRDTLLTIRFKDASFDLVFDYVVRDSGRVLVGIETLGPYFARVYRYRR